MTGLLNNAITGNFHGFLRFNGAGWDPVPGFETPAPIKDVLIHDDKLYVCGYFFTDTGGPGNMVTVFDGEQWSDMGGGLRYALPNSTSGIAYDLHELNGDIYVGGQFNFAGGVHAENVARWNGHQWCGMGGHYVTQTPGGQVFSLASWRDSLYVGGNFVTIDGDTLHNVAKWLGEVENCSPSVGIEELRESRLDLVLRMMDAEGVWALDLPDEPQELSIVDAFGRVVHNTSVNGRSMHTMDLRGLAIGCYFVRCTTGRGEVFRTKVFKP
ncbi:MAG: hypothetical protein IPH05_11760 [Flavobacteriales bacterium]|nr:hypothetical protein [Flavobacteriales bacterium]